MPLPLQGWKFRSNLQPTCSCQVRAGYLDSVKRHLRENFPPFLKDILHPDFCLFSYRWRQIDQACFLWVERYKLANWTEARNSHFFPFPGKCAKCWLADSSGYRKAHQEVQSADWLALWQLQSQLPHTFPSGCVECWWAGPCVNQFSPSFPRPVQCFKGLTQKSPTWCPWPPRWSPCFLTPQVF